MLEHAISRCRPLTEQRPLTEAVGPKRGDEECHDGLPVEFRGVGALHGLHRPLDAAAGEDVVVVSQVIFGVPVHEGVDAAVEVPHRRAEAHIGEVDRVVRRPLVLAVHDPCSVLVGGVELWYELGKALVHAPPREVRLRYRVEP